MEKLRLLVINLLLPSQSGMIAQAITFDEKRLL